MALIGEALIEVGIDSAAMQIGERSSVAALKRIEQASDKTASAVNQASGRIKASVTHIGAAADSAARSYEQAGRRIQAANQGITQSSTAAQTKMQALVQTALKSNVQPTAGSMMNFLQGKLSMQGLSSQAAVNEFTRTFQARHAAIREGQGATGAARAAAAATSLQAAAGASVGVSGESLNSIAAAAAAYGKLGDAGVESLNSIKAAAAAHAASTKSIKPQPSAGDKIFAETHRNLLNVERQGAIFGAGFDTAGQKVAVLTEGLKRMANEGLSPTNPRVQQLKRELGEATAAAGGFAGSLGGITTAARALGVGLSAAALVGFTTRALTAVGAVQDLSDRTGIAADTLIALKPIAENAGSSLDQVAAGVRAMQRQIVEGSPATISALGKLGISADEMLQLSADPEKFLDRFAEGLSNISNISERTSVAMDLATRAGHGLAPVLLDIAKNRGLANIKRESVITKEQIASIDLAQDKLNTLYNKMIALTAISANPVLQFFADIAEAAEKAAGQVSKFTEIFDQSQNLRDAETQVRAHFARKQGINPAFQPDKRLGGQTPVDVMDAGEGGVLRMAQGQAAAGGITMTDSQISFLESIKESNTQLKAQIVGITSTREAAVEASAEIIRTKAKELGMSKEFSAQLETQLGQFKKLSIEASQAQLADSIEKQNNAIKLQIVMATQGKAAYEELAMQQQLAESKLKNYGKAALDAAAAQKKLNDEAAKSIVKAGNFAIGQAKEESGRKEQVFGSFIINRAELDRQAIQSQIEKFLSDLDPRSKELSLTAAIKLTPELDKKTLESIQTDLRNGLRTDQFGALLNQTFTNTYDAGAASVARLEAALKKAEASGLPLNEEVRALAAQLDAAKFESAFSRMNREIEISQAEAQLLGRDFDLPAAKVNILTDTLRNLLSQGLRPTSAEAQILAERLAKAKVDSTFSDLAKDLERASAEAQVFGGSFDQAAANIDALTSAIKRLLDQGFKPLDPAIQDLKRQLEEQKTFQRYEEAADRAFDVVADGLTGQIKSWEDFAKRLGSVFDDLMRDLAKDEFKKIFRQIFKPPEISIPKPGNNIPAPAGAQIPESKLPSGVAGKLGEVGVGSASPAGIATQQFSMATSQFAIAVQQFAALAGGTTGALPTAGQIPAQIAAEQIGEFDIPNLGDSHEQWMSDADALFNKMQSDLEHAIETGGSLMSSGGASEIDTKLQDLTLGATAGPEMQMAATEQMTAATTFMAGVQQFAAVAGLVGAANVPTTGEGAPQTDTGGGASGFMPATGLVSGLLQPMDKCCGNELSNVFGGILGRIFGGTPIQDIAKIGIASIEGTAATSKEGVTATSSVAQSGLNGLVQTAMNTITGFFGGGKTSGGGAGLFSGIPILGDLFGGGGQKITAAQSMGALAGFDAYDAGGFGTPGRAFGGDVMAANRYLVGERGPEVFVPNISGRIMPLEGVPEVANSESGFDDKAWKAWSKKGGSQHNEFHFHGLTDKQSWDRSKGEIMADMHRATRRSEEYD